MASGLNNQDHHVCEMCGVEGNKKCLLACSKCGGHQHIYCMQTTMMELPEEWQCDECQENTHDQLDVVHSIGPSDREVENIIPISSETNMVHLIEASDKEVENIIPISSFQTMQLIKSEHSERATDTCMENLLLVSSAEAKQHEDSDILVGEDVNEGVDEFSVCPSKYCSWIGTFMINDEGFVDFKCLLEAYTLPTTTKRITKISSEMPEEIQLTVVARTTMETYMFPTSPTKSDIGLFFFCENDLECTRYLQILEQLDANDCVMKGLINNMELIVLSSKLLPLGSQYWLGKPFMWAVFQRIRNYKNICEFNAIVVQPDPIVVEDNVIVVQRDLVTVTGRNKKKSSRVGLDPVSANGKLKNKSSREEPDPVPVTGRIRKKSSRVSPDPVPITITGKIKKKSSGVGKNGSSLPPPPPTPTMNYAAPPPPLPPTPIINYIVSVPRIGDRKVNRGSRSCWDRNRMA